MTTTPKRPILNRADAIRAFCRERQCHLRQKERAL